jgi:2-dehydropantoate 2-reductase
LPLTEQARDHGLDAVHSVDPGGRMVRRFGPATIGGFTAAAAGQIADGTGNGLPATSLVRGDFPYTFGMPDGSRSPELGRLVETLRLGGLNVKQAGDISKETWIKILGNATFNMISVIFDASLRQIEQQAHLNRIALAMMNEVKNVAKRLDVPGAASFDLERRLKAVGALTHRPSTWGDFQSAPADRKTPELDALIGAVVELGTRFGVPTPLLAETYAGLQDLAEALGIYSRPTPAPGGKPALPPEGLKARLAMRLVAASVA